MDNAALLLKVYLIHFIRLDDLHFRGSLNAHADRTERKGQDNKYTNLSVWRSLESTLYGFHY